MLGSWPWEKAWEERHGPAECDLPTSLGRSQTQEDPPSLPGWGLGRRPSPPMPRPAPPPALPVRSAHGWREALSTGAAACGIRAKTAAFISAAACVARIHGAAARGTGQKRREGPGWLPVPPGPCPLSDQVHLPPRPGRCGAGPDQSFLERLRRVVRPCARGLPPASPLPGARGCVSSWLDPQVPGSLHPSAQVPRTPPVDSQSPHRRLASSTEMSQAAGNLQAVSV